MSSNQNSISKRDSPSRKNTSKDKKQQVQAREGKKEPKMKEMGKALIISIIEKLENRHVRIVPKEKRKDAINNLRLMLDFLKDKKVTEGSRLHYMIADIDEMANDVTNLDEPHAKLSFNHDMKSIKSWVKYVYAYVLKFGDDDRTEMESEKAGEGDIGADMVGREEDVKQLLSKAIFNEQKKLFIPFITGMLGIGKTALARKLYNHEYVVDRFPCRAWVRVPTDCSHKELLIKLVKQLVHDKELKADSVLEKMDNKSLQHMLRQNLKGRPYFIVLDDLHKAIKLQSILKGLPQEGKGSRLLFTSRTQNIHEHEISRHIHEVKDLDANKSWKLFLKTIESGYEVTSELNFPKELEKKGKEMLAKYGGVPLAIKEVARKLAEKKRSGSEWEELFESVDFGATETMKLLESHYHTHKSELKLIFLHLAFFKDKIVINSEKFILMCRAAGILPKGNMKNGYSDIRWLAQESLIEVKDHPMKRFRVNSLQRRLSIERAEEEIGFEILGYTGNNRPSQNPRHRVIRCSREKFNHSADQHNENLVSLVFHGGGCLDASTSYWKSLKLLRMLDFEDFGLKVLSEDIGTMSELRFLGLRNNHLKEIPHSLGCLINLEVLDVAHNFMVEMPDAICKMGRLHRLFISNAIWRKPLKIDTLRKLKTLIYISVDDLAYEVSGLRRMKKLKKLGIVEVDTNSDLKKLFASFAELKRLDYLILRGFRFRRMPSLDKLGILSRITKLVLDGLLASLPTADNFPPKLNYLKLYNSRLEEDPMPILEDLSNLKVLKLRNAYTGTEMVAWPKGFGSLHFLYIDELWNLTSLKFGRGSMKYLKHLEIKNCPYLETLPKEIGSMDYLDEVNMVTTKRVETMVSKSKLILNRRKPNSRTPISLVINDHS